MQVTIKEDKAILIDGQFLCRASNMGNAQKVVAWLEKFQIGGRKAFNARPLIEQLEFIRLCLITGDKWPFDWAPWCNR